MSEMLLTLHAMSLFGKLFKKKSNIPDQQINGIDQRDDEIFDSNDPDLKEPNQIKESQQIVEVIPAVSDKIFNDLEQPLITSIAIEQIDPENKKIVEPYVPTMDLTGYKYPGLDLLVAYNDNAGHPDEAYLQSCANQISSVLLFHSLSVVKINATVGPSVTSFELIMSPGARLAGVKRLEKELALGLAVQAVNVVSSKTAQPAIIVEVPNPKRSIVSLKSLLASTSFKESYAELPIILGKGMDGSDIVIDLTSLPHLLIAGSTGQGKSVCVDCIIISLLFAKHPSQLKFLFIDPKGIDLNSYKSIENHFLTMVPGRDASVISKTNDALRALEALCIEMDDRYELLKDAGTRNIKEYCDKFMKRKLDPARGHQYLPYIVVVISEFADYMSSNGKQIETPLVRLAQLSRAVGIHLIISTQRPTKNVITGSIKTNFNARISFSVPSHIDSRVILDTDGAEKLNGKGDMLFYHHGVTQHIQGAFVETSEVTYVSDFIGQQRGYPQPFFLPEYVSESEPPKSNFDLNEKDPLFEDAARLIVQNQMGSTSLLQRRMKLGYNRAGRLMDQLETAGVVGPNQGDKVREVLIRTELELNDFLNNL